MGQLLDTSSGLGVSNPELSVPVYLKVLLNCEKMQLFMRSSGTCYLLLTFLSDRKICLWLMLINMMLWLAFPVHQWAVLFSLEFLDLLELYLLWQSKQKLAVFTSYGFADSERTEHFSFCVWRQSKILALIHEAGVNREGSILSPLARSSLV